MAGKRSTRWTLLGAIALVGGSFATINLPTAIAEPIPQCKDVLRDAGGSPMSPYDNSGGFKVATYYWTGPNHGDGVRNGVVVTDGTWQNAGTEAAVVVGSPFADNITTQSNNDVICGRGGADTIDAGNGHDVIWGGWFEPTGPTSFVYRLNDNDNPCPTGTTPGFSKTINGNSGDDFIVAGLCGDFVRGGNGNDVIDDKGGNDDIHGDSQNDKINGDDGNDTIRGEADADEINGGRGNDTIFGGPGKDIMVGDHPSRCCNGNDLIDQTDPLDPSGGDQGGDIISGTWRVFFPKTGQTSPPDQDVCRITPADTEDGDIDPLTAGVQSAPAGPNTCETNN